LGSTLVEKRFAREREREREGGRMISASPWPCSRRLVVVKKRARGGSMDGSRHGEAARERGGRTQLGKRRRRNGAERGGEEILFYH